MIHTRGRLKLIIKSALLFGCALILSGQPVQAVFADNSLDNLINNGLPYYIPGDNCTTSNTNGGTGGAPVTLTDQQAPIAKTIVGVAKTLGLTQKAVLIAYMTVFQESHFHDWANDGHQLSGSDATNIKTFSESNPNSAGLPPSRGDHASVGPFQQQVTTGWSTFGGNLISQESVWQVMGATKSDQFAAYSAQAFFGTPPGSQLPSFLKNPGALQKGLINRVPNYNDPSVAPGGAAQTVQGSAFPDAYNKWQGQAQQLVDQYWGSSPAIPLTIPLTGGTAPGGAAGGTGATCTPPVGNVTTGKTATINKILSKIKDYAWPLYCRANASSCPGRPGGATDKNAAYAKAVNAGGYNGDPCYGGGVDCGAFVTHVMRDSGADPDYNKGNGPTSQQLNYLNANSNGSGSKKYAKIPPSAPLEPGDIAVKDGHTAMYIGDSLKSYGFKGDWASASQCERAPMAGPADTRSDYEWFRIII